MIKIFLAELTPIVQSNSKNDKIERQADEVKDAKKVQIVVPKPPISSPTTAKPTMKQTKPTSKHITTVRSSAKPTSKPVTTIKSSLKQTSKHITTVKPTSKPITTVKSSLKPTTTVKSLQKSSAKAVSKPRTTVKSFQKSSAKPTSKAKTTIKSFKKSSAKLTSKPTTTVKSSKKPTIIPKSTVKQTAKPKQNKKAAIFRDGIINHPSDKPVTNLMGPPLESHNSSSSSTNKTTNIVNQVANGDLELVIDSPAPVNVIILPISYKDLPKKLLKHLLRPLADSEPQDSRDISDLENYGGFLVM